MRVPKSLEISRMKVFPKYFLNDFHLCFGYEFYIYDYFIVSNWGYDIFMVLGTARKIPYDFLMVLNMLFLGGLDMILK